MTFCLKSASSVAQPILLFSYKSQVDDYGEEESVSLPHQHSFTSLKADSDYIYQVYLVFNILLRANMLNCSFEIHKANGCYDSTQLDVSSTPIHPLYAVSLRSPDSVTGYSLTSINTEHSINLQQ